MFRNLQLTKKKKQFIKNRTLLCMILSLILIAFFFLVCFFVESARNRTEIAAAMAARVNVLDEAAKKTSPVPIVEITEAPEGQVEEAESYENIEDNEELSIIYLTFDDGPGRYTERLLDILKKYNVKATFFVTDVYDGYTSLIKREYQEGHAVAIHTYTHDYDKIYASSEAFWNDSDAMQAIIKEQTGHETHLMRFPGGSSNTISDFNPGIMTQLAQEAAAKGFVYFDWNVTSGDAGETTDSEKVFENCKDGVQCQRISVVLCHDVKEYTVDAMEDFIKWALENDYTFLPLQETSYTSHHDINN